jgi:hypothetical protein
VPATRPHNGQTADRDRDWNWSQHQPEELDALLKHDGWEAVAEAHAWHEAADSGLPDRKGAYKLPHHELIGGEVKVVWRGVSHAMNVLAGGRGGVSIPARDRMDVWRHLAKHYEQFGEEPPEAPGRG